MQKVLLALLLPTIFIGVLGEDSVSSPKSDIRDFNPTDYKGLKFRPDGTVHPMSFINFGPRKRSPNFKVISSAFGAYTSDRLLTPSEMEALKKLRETRTSKSPFRKLEERIERQEAYLDQLKIRKDKKERLEKYLGKEIAAKILNGVILTEEEKDLIEEKKAFGEDYEKRFTSAVKKHGKVFLDELEKIHKGSNPTLSHAGIEASHITNKLINSNLTIIAMEEYGNKQSCRITPGSHSATCKGVAYIKAEGDGIFQFLGYNNIDDFRKRYKGIEKIVEQLTLPNSRVSNRQTEKFENINSANCLIEKSLPESAECGGDVYLKETIYTALEARSHGDRDVQLGRNTKGTNTIQQNRNPTGFAPLETSRGSDR